MKRKLLLPIIAASLCAAMVMGLSGCGSDSNDGNNTQAPTSTAANNAPATDAGDDTTTAAEATNNAPDASKIIEFMKTAEITNTIEELNAIFGFKSTSEDKESYFKDTWTFSDDATIVAIYNEDGKISSIKADFDDELITAKADFSKYNEIEAALDTEESINYDAFVEIVGGVQGTIVEKGSVSNSYRWVNNDGGYLKGVFSNSDGKCTFVSGWF